MTRDRIRKGSVSLIAILLIVILMALPTGYEDAAIYKGTDRVRAKVLSTDESSVINNGLIQSGEQYCKVKILGGKFKGEETKAVNMLSGSLEADKIFQEGDIAQVVISYSNGEILSVMMSDHYRLDKELLLAGIFVLLLIGFAAALELLITFQPDSRNNIVFSCHSFSSYKRSACLLGRRSCTIIYFHPLCL